MLQIWRAFIGVIAFSLTAFCLVFGFLFFFLQVKGLKPYVILSGSMEPAIGTGSVVVVDPALKGSAGEGDAVAYKLKDGPVVVHRFVGTAQDGTFVMKGDNNNASDMERVEPSQVIGPVVRVVPKAGYVMQYFIRTDRGISLTALWLVAAMVAFNLYSAYLEKQLQAGVMARGRGGMEAEE